MGRKLNNWMEKAALWKKEALSASQKVLICSSIEATRWEQACNSNLCYSVILLGTDLSNSHLKISQEFSSWSPKRPNKKDPVMVYVELRVARWQRTPDPPLPPPYWLTIWDFTALLSQLSVDTFTEWEMAYMSWDCIPRFQSSESSASPGHRESTPRVIFKFSYTT